MDANSAETLESVQAERDKLRALLAERESRLARLEADHRRAVNESYAIYMTGLDIMSQLDLPSTLLSILRRIKIMVNVDASLLYLAEPSSGHLVVSAELDIAPSLLGQQLSVDNSPLHEVKRTGIPLVLDHYGKHMARLHGEQFAHYHTAALLPLRWQGNVIGVVSLYHSDVEDAFSLDDLDSLQHITVQAAIAIYNAQQYAAEQERNRQLAMLYQASVQVTSSLDLDAVLHAAAVSFMDMLRVPACAIYEYRPEDGLHLISHYGTAANQNIVQSSAAKHLPSHLSPMITNYHWVVLQRSDPMLSPECVNYLEARQAHSVLLIPMRFENGAQGIVEVMELSAPRQFLMNEINTAQALAANMSIAVSHAQLHAQLRAQRISEQAVLLTLARQLLELKSEYEIAEAVASATAEAFAVRHVSLVLQKNGVFSTRALRGWENTDLINRTWLSGDGTAIGYVIKTRELCVVDDYQTEVRFAQPTHFRQSYMRSSMIAPIIYGGAVLGVLAIARPQPFAFSSDDTRLFSLIAYQTAVALDRAHLIESVRAQNATLERRVQQRTQEISAAQERTVAILFATGESLIVFDQNGNVELVNGAFEEQHGYSLSEARQRTSTELLGFDVFDLIKEAQTSDGVPQRVWRGDRIVPRRHADPYDAAVTLSRVPDAKGETIGIVASLRDISYIKEVSRMKANFISNVSHELRTPLANLKLYLHLMQKGSAERRDHYLGTMQRESDRLQVLIEDLLTLSRLDSDRVQINLQATDLNNLIGTLVVDRQMLAEQRGLTLAYTPDSISAIVMLDAKLIMQAVGNLISNAMNYTPPGGNIHVSVLHSEKRAIICVADSGLGIAPEEQSRLFDRFFRGSAAQRTGAAGTGLGMAIVQEIAAKHGGNITFESELGQGSTFYLHLPLHTTLENGN
ncbi:MAG: GAF domain-containing protein [Chloroflexi bacterium CFX4]|nr:GAF domain-containing protein [Chloroflexi bacterium CFX4]MDL1922043.1 GAF domain-containing protein [Chloroflexi bacterium CFX3]